MNDRSDPSHHERTLLPRSYISLLIRKTSTYITARAVPDSVGHDLERRVDAVDVVGRGAAVAAQQFPTVFTHSAKFHVVVLLLLLDPLTLLAGKKTTISFRQTWKITSHDTLIKNEYISSWYKEKIKILAFDKYFLLFLIHFKRMNISAIDRKEKNPEYISFW